jgi:ribonuclease P protein component
MRPRLGRLKARPEFLLVAGKGRKWTTPGLILQARRREAAADEAAADEAGADEAGADKDRSGEDRIIRVGFTVSRKVGGAVERNRAKRRLRALVAERLEQGGRPGTDYVLIGRQGTIRRPFELLRQDLDQALAGVERSSGERARR